MQALLGTLTVGLIGLLGSRLFGRRAGLIAMGMAAVYPPLVIVDSTLVSETLFIPLVLAATLAALEAGRAGRGWRLALVSGLLLGAAVLTRANGLLLLLPLMVLAARSPGRVRTAAVMVAAVAVVLVPWTVRNAISVGAFVPLTTQTGYTLAGTYNDATRTRTSTSYRAAWIDPRSQAAQYRSLLTDPVLDEPALDRELTRQALGYIRRHPGYVGEVALHNLRRLSGLDRSYARASGAAAGTAAAPAVVGAWAGLALLALAALGALTGAVRHAPRILWLVPALLATTVFVSSAVRFRAPVDPFLLLLGALALEALLLTCRRRGDAPTAAV